MLPTPAQYLLRFDDLCPTMNAERWRPFQSLIEEFRLRPILAVVPDNRDNELQHSPPDPNFWTEMRALETGGAAIALHGYQHLCTAHGRGLVPLHDETEFAGVSAKIQREWIHDGLGILRGHGLNPRLWVAPRHGFDSNTLQALRDEGIGALSDGFARVPFERDGLMWIPQQLWGPVEKAKGLWTICIHPNTASDTHVDGLREFVRRHLAQFTSVERVLAEFPPTRLSFVEWAYARCAVWRILVSRPCRRRSDMLRLSKSQ